MPSEHQFQRILGLAAVRAAAAPFLAFLGDQLALEGRLSRGDLGEQSGDQDENWCR